MSPYTRMTVVSVDCPACRAHRGELCRGAFVRELSSTVHADRTSSMQSWRKQNPQKYRLLRVQALVLSEILTATKPTKPASQLRGFEASELLS